MNERERAAMAELAWRYLGLGLMLVGICETADWPWSGFLLAGIITYTQSVVRHGG